MPLEDGSFPTAESAKEEYDARNLTQPWYVFRAHDFCLAYEIPPYTVGPIQIVHIDNDEAYASMYSPFIIA